MTTPQAATALPHPAPGARTDFKLLVLFLIALQVLIVTSAAQAVQAATAYLEDRLPEASDTILREAPRPPPSRLAQV